MDATFSLEDYLTLAVILSPVFLVGFLTTLLILFTRQCDRYKGWKIANGIAPSVIIGIAFLGFAVLFFRLLMPRMTFYDLGMPFAVSFYAILLDVVLVLMLFVKRRGINQSTHPAPRDKSGGVNQP